MPAPCLHPRNSGNQICRMAAHSPPRRIRKPYSHLVPYTPLRWRSVLARAALPPTGGEPGSKGQPGRRPLRPIQGLLRPGPLLPGNACFTRAHVRLRGSGPVRYIATDTPTYATDTLRKIRCKPTVESYKYIQSTTDYMYEGRSRSKVS